MSAPPVSPKRFLLAVSGDLINVDFVRLVHEDAATGKVFADMTTGLSIELLVDKATINDLRHTLPLNHL